jgi:hypothetical protein
MSWRAGLEPSSRAGTSATRSDALDNTGRYLGDPTFVRARCRAFAFVRNGIADAVGHATAAASDTVSTRDCRHAASGPLGQRAVSLPGGERPGGRSRI